MRILSSCIFLGVVSSQTAPDIHSFLKSIPSKSKEYLVKYNEATCLGTKGLYSPGAVRTAVFNGVARSMEDRMNGYRRLQQRETNVTQLLSIKEDTYGLYDRSTISVSHVDSDSKSTEGGVSSDIGGGYIMVCEYQKMVEMDVCKLESGEVPDVVWDHMSNHPCVDFVEASTPLRPVVSTDLGPTELNETRSSESISYPNDPGYSNQWYLHDDSQFSLKSESMWKAFESISVTTSSIILKNGHKVKSNEDVVAVVDTGTFLKFPTSVHDDLEGQLWRNEADCDFDGMDSDNNGYIDDCFGWNFGSNTNDVTDYMGHGTTVAGLVSAATSNRVGLASIGHKARIMSLVTFFTSAEFTKIVNYIVGARVKVMNGSFALPLPDKALKHLVKSGEKHGVVMVFAASNENCDNDSILASGGYKKGCDLYPGAFDLTNIIAVCATDKRGSKAFFSSYGQTSVDVCAPGHQVAVLRNPRLTNQMYALSSGTSFASPLVAGLAAMINIATGGRLSPSEIKAAIMKSCNKSSELEKISACGGIVNAFDALTIANLIPVKEEDEANLEQEGLLVEPLILQPLESKPLVVQPLEEVI